MTSGISLDRDTRCLRLTIPPTLEYAEKARRLMERVSEVVSLGRSRTYDLKLVVSEAVANAVEHSSADGEIDMVVWMLDDHVTVEVTNPGTFRPGSRTDSEGRRRGLGLPLMVSLADQVRISRLPEGRTQIALTFMLPLGGKPVEAERPVEETVGVNVELDGSDAPLNHHAFITDLTEQKRAEARLQASNAILAGTVSILEAALTTPTERELADVCLGVAEEVTESTLGFIGELGPDDRLYDITISNPGWEACTLMDPTGHRRVPGAFRVCGLYGRVLRDGRGFFTNRPSSHPDSVGLPAGHPPLSAFLGVPLMTDGEVSGMIGVGNREGGYSQEQLEALERLAPVVVEAFSRKRAEERIRGLSQRLGYHIEHSPLAVIEWGPDMRIVRWSGEAERMFGWSADEVMGRRIGDFRWVYDDDTSHVAEVSSELQDGTNPRRFSANRNYRKDGSIIHCEWYNSSLLDESGELQSILSLVLDVTERTLAEEEVRRQGQLLAAVPDAVISTDAGFRIVSWNPAAESMYGWSEREVVGRGTEEILRTEYEGVGRTEVEEQFRTSGRWAGEVVQRRRDGTRFWVQSAVVLLKDSAGHPVGAVAVNRDVTERKRLEKELSRKEEEARHLIRYAPAAVYEIDVPGHRFVSANDRMCEISGYSQEELLQTSPFELLDEESRVRFGRRIQAAMAGGRPEEIVEYTARTKDGRTLSVVLNVSMVYEEGRPVRALVVGHDITERKRAEEALRASEDRTSAALSAARLGVWDQHLETGEVLWDERSSGMWGMEAGAKIDQEGVFARIHPDDREAVGCAAQEARNGKNGGAFHQRFRVVWPDRSVHWVDSHGQVFWEGVGEARRPIRFVGFNQDITEEKLAEEQREALLVREQELTEELATANEELQAQNEELAIQEEELRSQNYELFLAQGRLKASHALSQALNAVNESLTSTLELEEVLRRVVVESARAVGCQAAVLELREEQGWVVKELFGLEEHLRGLRLSDEQASVACAMMRHGDVLAIEDCRKDERVYASTVLRYGTKAALAVPLILRDEIVGSLMLCWLDGPHMFQDIETDFARKLSASIALALENARLYTEQRIIAVTLQQALLTVPATLPGLAFGHLHRSATEDAEIGGDFYDLFLLPGNRLGIILGDVAGRGIAAANMAALVKNTIKAYAHRHGTPAQVLADTNHMLIESNPTRRFVTAFFGLLDIETGRLTFSSAGHPPAALRAADRTLRLLDHAGWVLGLFPDAEYTDAEVTLALGDLLVLYTDGLTEARQDGTFFGEHRVIESLISWDDASAAHVPGRLLQEALAFTGGPLRDDLAILALELVKD